MRTKLSYVAATFIAALLINSSSVFAQPMNQRPMRAPMCAGMENMIPKLTDDQKAKIQEFRVAHMKEVTPIQNMIKEKQARLNTLTSADKQDMNEVNKTIDEIAKLKADLMKKRVEHQNQIRSILTDEQKVYFNAHIASGRGMMGQGNGQGMHRGKGMRNGRGMGMGMNPQRPNRGQCIYAQPDSTK